ncbi:TPA: DUF3114 domain-containing protein [Streptococcus pyogenes]|uniref:DUF3114 domain-containing protein n=1 Tax=Streptococcus pyogenes TaxID=1314 RepID=UPI0010A169F6|nr:DUF3114 domain-containing protein [Streptococcus pyogenes]HEP6115913.1 DUF3114 domain-containing protein [Streptococcus pyogenes]HEQ2365422.1 DUF3114 domain-containing protein [Streptococcus pyogenes]HEQ4464848.1 DUF3114 domain-containing protein [Streptococcus pyogenes]HEQ8518781.1 DUF3114 domain-containing protein [Streptococcus pyogenes]HEQ9369576.1 DUF3114 domain-containing protein [Streptococcus pyogenes]
MKLLGKWLFFLMFLTFCVSFWQKDYQRIAFEKEHKLYQDLVAPFYQNYPKLRELQLSEAIKLRHDLLDYVRKLDKDGWSYKAIQKGYLEQLAVRGNSYHFEQLYNRIRLIGSPDFQKLWQQEEMAQTPQEAQKRLQLLLTYLKMPDELTGQSKQTQQVLAQLSPKLSPTDPFWDQLSTLIQAYYVNLEHIPYSRFNRKIHQLRYLISTQQTEWVRSHYGNKEKTDADALAKYLATLEDDDYALYESSRYHNKVASILDANGNHQAVYTDNIPQANYKILIHFHSEFILSESGQFLVALDPDNLTRNSIVNGSSFNYGNQNDDLHRLLDIDPILLFDPAFIEKAINSPDATFLVPDLEQQRDKHNPIYSRNGKSSKQLTRAAVKKFKKLIHHYQETRGDNKTSKTQH